MKIRKFKIDISRMNPEKVEKDLEIAEKMYRKYKDVDLTKAKSVGLDIFIPKEKEC